MQAATSNVQAAQDALRSVKQLESYLEIRAPFNGVVTLRNLHPGALVGPASGTPGAQPIVQVEDLDRLRLVIPVPEAYAAGVREGQQVPFNVPAYPGQMCIRDSNRSAGTAEIPVITGQLNIRILIAPSSMSRCSGSGLNRGGSAPSLSDLNTLIVAK